MTLGGWIVMISSVGGVTALLAWCVYKVMTTPKSPRMHGFEVMTPDEQEERWQD